MKAHDSGPPVRLPSDAVRIRARSTVMSQIGDGPHAMAGTGHGADLVTFDRSGPDDAPGDTKRRWLLGVAGLAAAAIGAAIVLGPALRGDDLGLTPASTERPDTMLSQDEQDTFANDCFLLAMDADNYDADLREMVRSTLTFDPMTLATHHVTDEYQFVVIRNGLVQTTCVGDANDQLSTRFTETPGEDPLDFISYSRGTLMDSGKTIEFGKVDDTVVSMTVTSPEGQIDATVEDGYYSFVQTNDYETVDRTYEVTYENGSTRTNTTP